jgi:hypothetical protein
MRELIKNSLPAPRPQAHHRRRVPLPPDVFETIIDVLTEIVLEDFYTGVQMPVETRENARKIVDETFQPQIGQA